MDSTSTFRVAGQVLVFCNWRMSQDATPSGGSHHPRYCYFIWCTHIRRLIAEVCHVSLSSYSLAQVHTVAGFGEFCTLGY